LTFFKFFSKIKLIARVVQWQNVPLVRERSWVQFPSLAQNYAKKEKTIYKTSMFSLSKDKLLYQKVKESDQKVRIEKVL